MSDTSGGFAAAADLSKVGPDYFTFYTREVKGLLSENEDFLPFATEFSGKKYDEGRGKVNSEPPSSAFFTSSVGTGLSDYKKERLNILLQQTVSALTPEVDEMLDPVVAMRQLQSQVRSRKLGETRHKNAKKKIKDSAFKFVDSKYSDVALSEEEISNGVQKDCARCSTKTPKRITDPGGNFECDTCGIACKNSSESHLGPNTSAGEGDEEGDDDLQFLLENDSLLVEEIIKKYSDQLYNTLDHMEKQLEELLDTVVSTCRPMTLTEKQQLQKLIQNLPPKNLNRVVEIVRHFKPVDTQHSGEIFVDLEREDNATLWRLYYYVEAVEKARKLSS